MELDECAAILYVKDKDSKEEEIKEEYYILKKIGLGGTSIVYLCQSSLDGHEYALKLYSNIDAYQTETQLLRLIQSSNNIVKLIKSGEGILERGNSLDNASVADFIGKNSVKFAVFEYLPNGELLEYATFANNYYGTPISFVEKLRNEGKNVLLEIEPKGGLQVMGIAKRNHDDRFVSIFVAPQHIEEL